MLSSKCFHIGTRASRPVVAVRSLGFGTTGAFPDGSKVTVKEPITVFHVPKHQAGLNLQGMVGEVEKDASLYKGKVLSPNFPIVVKFQTELDGKVVKFKVHLGEDELQMA